MSRLSLLNATEGEIREGRCRLAGVREPYQEGAPYKILELGGSRECANWGWLLGDLRRWANALNANDEIWIRCRVAKAWPSGAYDVDILEIQAMDSDAEISNDEAWMFEDGIPLDLPHALASYVQRLLAQDLAAGAHQPGFCEVPNARALTVFLHDALPSSLRTPVPAPVRRTKRIRAA